MRSPHAAPVKLLALFVLLSGIPLVALGWLGWRVLQQDGALESQRVRERLDNAASLVARELDRGLTTWEALLPAAAGGQAVALPPRTVFLLIATDGVVQQQGAPLPYYPRVPSASSTSSPLFAVAERQEFREQNLSAAIAAYRAVAVSNDESIRAEALMRLARCFRKQERMSDALAAYAYLAVLGDVSVADSPAELGVARLQSDFVAAVSHEFRTPLTAMCHLTEILEQGNAGPERLSEYYRALGKESRRLHTMMENLLDFGRMDSGRRTYEFSETDAVELVDHVAHEFADRSAVAARRIEKSPLRPPGQAMIIHADREALALALRNLLDNAMKYSPDLSPVRVAVTALNGTVAVSIEDQGPGVSAQERREIFRKFTRGAAARSLNVKGTGIGLTMANEIVNAHGGRLELESEPGRGSTFTMVLPAMPR